MPKSKRVSQWIGKATGIGPIPAVQVLPLMFCFCLSAVVLIVTKWNWVVSCGTLVVTYGTWWALTRNKPVDFLEQFHKPKKWVSRSEECEFNSLGIPLPPVPASKSKKLPDGSLDVKGQFYLATYGEFRIKGRKVGFYLLKNNNRYMAVFGWEVEGQDPYISEAEAEDVLTRWSQGLQQMPSDVDFKIYDDCTGGDSAYIQMQEDLYDSCEDRSDLEYAMKASSVSRYTELCQKGQALKKRLRIFAKYRFTLGVSAHKGKKDPIEAILANLEPFIDKFRSTQDAQLLQWEKSVDAIWDTFDVVESILTGGQGFGLKVSPISAKTFWEDNWYELHNRPAPPIPQLLIVEEGGLFVEDNSSLHSLSVLFQPEDGLPTQPQTERDRVYLPVKNIHKGFLRFDKAISFRGQGDDLKLGELRFFLNALRGTEQPVRNYRVVIELTYAPSFLEGINLDRAITNAISRQNEALKHGNWDAAAKRQGEEAQEARDQLLDKNPLFWVSAGVWLDRESPELLTRDLTEVSRLFPTVPNERAWECTEDIYFQSQPYYWEALLTNPHHRRQKYQSIDMLPLLPLAQVRGLEKKGVAFFTQETAEQVFIDLVEGLNHAMIVATTRASKSILLAQIILSFYTARAPVVAFDFPGPDGISTYTDFIELLRMFGAKCAYYDVKKQSMNLLDMPNLRGFSFEDAQERRNHIRDKHIEDIVAYIMGNNPDSRYEQITKSFISQIYVEFMADPGIKARYEAAHQGGFGSEAHWQTPTLLDFLEFAEVFFRQHLAENQETASDLSRSCIDQTLQMLRMLRFTDLGRAIAQPSSFDTDVDLLVIAMTQVNSDFETSMYASAGLGVLLRQALSHSSCGFFVDEGTILFDRPSFSSACAQIAANGLKWGCHLIICAQTVEKITRSVGGETIKKNMQNTFVGHIQEVAYRGIVEDLYFRENMLRPFVSEASKPSAQHLRSNWYLKRNDLHILLHHYPSELLLALCANNPPEKEARQRVFAFFQDDLLRGLIVFAEHYSRVVRQGQNLTTETDRFVAQLERQFAQPVPAGWDKV